MNARSLQAKVRKLEAERKERRGRLPLRVVVCVPEYPCRFQDYEDWKRHAELQVLHRPPF